MEVMISMERNRFSTLVMRRAESRPIAVKTIQNPTALAQIRPTSPQSTCPPAVWMREIATTTARSTIPSTSSSTAAARIVTPSGESILRLSARMRAVIPTEVAVDTTPRNSAAGEENEGATRNRTAAHAPPMKDTITPPTPTAIPTVE
ncbi:MAG: hypothetical protein BWY59_00603 [Verrucomicrobia bacterium ADurb.Bin345]|nr:MAG: hypothetical protein BWY59_00603 [Verrucomicrobia bacterium ADurb.Bin345]